MKTLQASGQMPADIPQDVWQVAIEVAAELRPNEFLMPDAALPVARAILDERDRCALAAERRGKELGEYAVGSDIANTVRMGGEA